MTLYTEQDTKHLKQRNEELEIEVERLRIQVESLKEIFAQQTEFPGELELTNQEKRILGLLMSKDVVHTQQFQHALTWDKTSENEKELHEKHIPVLISRLRAKLEIEISCVRETGYRMTTASKEKIVNRINDVYQSYVMKRVINVPNPR